MLEQVIQKVSENKNTLIRVGTTVVGALAGAAIGAAITEEEVFEVPEELANDLPVVNELTD